MGKKQKQKCTESREQQLLGQSSWTDDKRPESIEHHQLFEHLPWTDMVEGATGTCKNESDRLDSLSNCNDKTTDGELPCCSSSECKSPNDKTKDEELPPKHEHKQKTNSREGMNQELRLALYVAMAHGGLIMILVALYGLGKLLQDFWTPIQWALLCSIPLREIQSWLVEFWREPLSRGLLATVLALPFSLFNAMSATLHDFLSALELISCKSKNKKKKAAKKQPGFSKLMRWMLSFGLFVFTYERLGPAAWVILLFAGCIIYAGRVTMESELEQPREEETNVQIQKSMSLFGRSKRGLIMHWEEKGVITLYNRFSRYLRRHILKRLDFVVAVFLISIMIVGSVAGVFFFSYKMGVEGKDAVVALKNQVQQSEYVDLGLKQWMDDQNIAQAVDQYTLKLYDTLSNQIDEFALQYNLTDMVNSFKFYLIGAKSNESLTPYQFPSNASQPISQPITQTLQTIRFHIRNRDFRAVYRQIDGIVRDLSRMFIVHFQISREEFSERAKNLAIHGLEVSKRLYQSGTLLLTSGGSLIFSICVSLASGAAGIINFLSQSVVFFWLLYYLITSETGGVMDHVVSMMPISKPTRRRCAKVLNDAVSSVLLDTAKIAFFQATFTWLLFRFFHIHFVYMSTMLAFVNAVLPIFPIWVCSLPALIQLWFEGQYIKGCVLGVLHLWILDYGVVMINADVSGYDSYLTGLSIIGGMALFSSALEGAIMGPLILTFMMALRNLYREFILVAFEDVDAK